MSHSAFSIIVLLVSCIIYPFAIIWVRETRPDWMRGWRCCLFALGALAVSWGVFVGFSDLSGPVYISREMTRGGMRELHAAVIAFSVKEGRLVLYCPRF